MDNGADSYRRFLDGDDRGITEIVEAYKDGLMLFLNGYVRSLSVAEELTEDTFFRLITKKPRFSGRSSFRSWLFGIGRHVAMDHLRRRAGLSDAPPEELEQFLTEAQSPEEASLTEERKRLLHRALSTLSPDYRQVLWLVYFEGFSNREVSAAMKKNDRQIRNLLYRAKHALRIALDREGFQDEDF